MLGGAVGDALGAAVEFDKMSDIRKRFGADGITAYAPCYGRRGAITDDTQMTLFTAEGLLRGHARFINEGKSALVRDEVLNAYWRWLKTQGERPAGITEDEIGAGGLLDVAEMHSRRAPGNTCLSALRSGEQGSSDNSLNDSKGCGAVMRAAPVGLFLQSPELLNFIPGDEVDEAAFDLGCEVGALTHSHPSGYLPSGCLALIIGRIIDGDDLRTAIKICIDRLKTRAGHFETLAAINQAITLADDTSHHPSPETLRTLGEGWVGEEALAMALYCALVAENDFDRALFLAVNHDGDSDSTGAIVGNILGALLGIPSISEQWLADLELKEVIEKMGIDLYFGRQSSLDQGE
jgi:ADP-ribosylglycohydrolase